MGVEGRRLMAAQPGGLTSGLAMHLVFTSWRTGLRSGYQVENVRPIWIGRLPVCGLLRNTGNTGLRTHRPRMYVPYGTVVMLLTLVIFSTFDDSSTTDRLATKCQHANVKNVEQITHLLHVAHSSQSANTMGETQRVK